MALFKENIIPSIDEFEIGNDILYSNDIKGFGDKHPDCFMTALLY